MRVADRLIDKGLWAGVVTLKIKYRDHRIRTRQMQMVPAVADTDAIFGAAIALLNRLPDLGFGVRLTGVSASGLSTTHVEELFPDPERSRRERLASTTQALRNRFGADSLTRASLISERDRGRDSARTKRP